jgi:hypothetical protein
MACIHKLILKEKFPSFLCCLYQSCGSVLFLMRIRILRATPMRIRIQVRLCRHKKLNFHIYLVNRSQFITKYLQKFIKTTLRTTSEISKSLSGSGIFLLACTVFSSPGNRAVRATCTTRKDFHMSSVADP